MKSPEDVCFGKDHKTKIQFPATVNDTFKLPVSDKDTPFDVVGFGLNSMDHLCVAPEYPERGGKKEMVSYEQRAGGQVATALTFVSRMGMKAKYIGKLGDDDFGRACREELEKSGIDTTSVKTERGARNQFSVIIIDQQSGERTVLTRREPGLDMRESELDENALCRGRVVHMDGYDPASVKAVRLCRRKGIPVCLDLDAAVPGCRQLLESADILIVSSHFPRMVTGIADPVEGLRSLR
ncbi:MAG TPA: PfkB family carbohydrate kinase, partial [Acidobacteriota bacterium]|nr:PfkB family carbohydrate kinase [Acidobacteriota bacterium]